MNPQVQEKKKNRIAETFQEHVEVFGFNKTSVDEIAGSLRISKKTIYQLFSSKQEIFNYVVEMKSGGFTRDIREILLRHYTHRQKIKCMVELFLNHRIDWNQNQNSLKTRHKAEIARAAFSRAFFDLLDDLVRDGIKRNIYTVKDTRLTLAFIRSILLCAESRIRLEPDPTLERETVTAINRLLSY
ncbi:MAG: TetR/AcrR family transcriptional regulator [FCB group bacterium]|nr:TetR/AcrR family transcriptional regulator [FCB group bacterium]